MSTGRIRLDLLPAELTDEERVIVASYIEGHFDTSALSYDKALVPQEVDRLGNETYSSRATSLAPAKDIDGFAELMLGIINDRLTRENISAKDKLIFSREFPPVDARSEAITYRLIMREPGTTSQGKQFNKERQQWRPLLREVIPDPECPNKTLFVYGTWYDNLIELSCWARTAKVADARALWLETLMSDYMWYLKAMGISDIRYQGRETDRHETVNDEKLFCRPLRYYVRTEKISSVSEYMFTQLILNLRIRE